MQTPIIGQLLGNRYRVIETLSHGGFGQTYIAEDTHRPNHPKCVVKHLKPASSDSGFLTIARRLFSTEAETLEKLGTHEQIPRLLAYFEEEREFYLVQEWVQGHTLTHEMQAGQQWTDYQVCLFLREILNILTFVHRNQVIHRDIKPDNLIRCEEDGRLVLVDFGAVKQIRTQVAGQNMPIVTVAVGTPGYIPTEQSAGRPRFSSDIYALGMTAIQALTGVSPCHIQTDPETEERVWRHLVSVDDGLANLLDRMVRDHFRERYQTVEEVLQDLEPLIARYESLGIGNGAAPPLAPTHYIAATVNSTPGTTAPPSSPGIPGTVNSTPGIHSTPASSPLAGTGHSAPGSPVNSAPGSIPGTVNSIPGVNSTPGANSGSPSGGASGGIGQPSGSPQPTVSVAPIQALSHPSGSPASGNLHAGQPAHADLYASGGSAGGSAGGVAPTVSGGIDPTVAKVPLGQVAPAHPVLSRPWLWMGSGAVLLLLGLGIGGFYWFQQQAQNRSIQLLQQAKTLQSEAKYQECIDQASFITQGTADLQAAAQMLLQQCQLASAQQLAEQGSLRDAILLASQIPAESPEYAEALEQIEQWSEKILQVATDRLNRDGNLEEAVQIAEAIPESSPVYQKAQDQIATWKQDWEKYQEILQAAKQAQSDRQWQTVLDQAEQLPDTPYWQSQAKPLIDQAESELNKPVAPAAPAPAAPAPRASEIPTGYEGRPIYEEPAYQEPVYQEPYYEEPAYSAPSYQEPVYQPPVYEPPPAPVAPPAPVSDCPPGVQGPCV